MLSNIEPPALWRKAATDKLVEKIFKRDSWPTKPDILSPPLLRLTSRKPLWLDLQPVDIKSRWRHNWKSAQVVNSHLVYDPTVPATGFRPPAATVLSHFHTEQRHCGACRKKRRLTHSDLCPCGETQTMSYMVESRPLTKLNGGLSRLHSADEDVVSVVVHDTHTRRRRSDWHLGSPLVWFQACVVRIKRPWHDCRVRISFCWNILLSGNTTFYVDLSSALLIVVDYCFGVFMARLLQDYN